MLARAVFRLRIETMSSPAGSTAAVREALRRFRRNRRGSAAVEFALVAPVFIALLFAIFETTLVFFAGQVLENGVQDSGRLFFTNQANCSGMSQTDFKQSICDRVSALMSCSGVDIDVRSYAAGTAITIADPINGSGNYSSNSVYQPPVCNSTDQTVVVRGFYQWPLIVTGLGYNIANIGRGSSNSKRLLAATSAFRPQ
jgi:Flp pilus assembly protein TadG